MKSSPALNTLQSDYKYLKFKGKTQTKIGEVSLTEIHLDGEDSDAGNKKSFASDEIRKTRGQIASETNMKRKDGNEGLAMDFQKFINIHKTKQSSESKIHSEKKENTEEGKTERSAREIEKKRDQTDKIMAIVNKRLKISRRPKGEHFDHKMNVFRNVETYVEIKPFLEQLNLVNHIQFLKQISEYENNIKKAQEQQQLDEKVIQKTNSLAQLASDLEIISPKFTNLKKQLSNDYPFKVQLDLLARANKCIAKADNNNAQFKQRRTKDSVLQRLLNQLGFQENKPKDNSVDEKTSPDEPLSQSNLSSKLPEQNGGINGGISRMKLSKNMKELRLQTQKPTVRRTTEDTGDLMTDDNQFYVNLKNYLFQAQKDASLSNEQSTDNCIYSTIIEQNQRKIDELKHNQFSMFMNGELDPQKLSEEGQNIEAAEYHQKYREKAQQIRRTFNKINKALYEKKWANAQVKTQMERQREKNLILAKFKIQKNILEKDILSPSYKMNEKLLMNVKRNTLKPTKNYSNQLSLEEERKKSILKLSSSKRNSSIHEQKGTTSPFTHINTSPVTQINTSPPTQISTSPLTHINTLPLTHINSIFRSKRNSLPFDKDKQFPLQTINPMKDSTLITTPSESGHNQIYLTQLTSHNSTPKAPYFSSNHKSEKTQPTNSGSVLPYLNLKKTHSVSMGIHSSIDNFKTPQNKGASHLQNHGGGSIRSPNNRGVASSMYNENPSQMYSSSMNNGYMNKGGVQTSMNKGTTTSMNKGGVKNSMNSGTTTSMNNGSATLMHKGGVKTSMNNGSTSTSHSYSLFKSAEKRSPSFALSQLESEMESNINYPPPYFNSQKSKKVIQFSVDFGGGKTLQNEDQQKIENIIKKIDEQRDHYLQEKPHLAEQIELIRDTYATEINKFQSSQRIESIRGINQTTSQKQYYSGLKRSLVSNGRSGL